MKIGTTLTLVICILATTLFNSAQAKVPKSSKTSKGPTVAKAAKEKSTKSPIQAAKAKSTKSPNRAKAKSTKSPTPVPTVIPTASPTQYCFPETAILQTAVSNYIDQNCATNSTCDTHTQYGEIGTWCVKLITNMGGMFYNASNFQF